MRLTIKTLDNKVFNIDAEPSNTVAELKSMIQTEKGNEYPTNGQKLIYAGKMLKDELTLSQYKIDETGFLVIIVNKPKSTPSIKQDPSVSAYLENLNKLCVSPPEDSKEVNKGKVEGSKETSISHPPTTNIDAVSHPESTFVTGEETETMIVDLMNMGFDRDSVIRALRASFHNPSRAVEYLVNGLPPELLIPTEAANNPAQNPNVVPEQLLPPSETPIGQEVEGEDSLAFLRTLPQFRQMRQIVQQNPNLLQLFIQQLGQQNPQLLQRITENQERFIQMLNEPDTAEAPIGAAPGNVPPAMAENQIVVTQQEREAIERLKAMGFPESLVVQAYFACDKDESLAVNFLLSQNYEDE